MINLMNNNTFAHKLIYSYEKNCDNNINRVRGSLPME